MFQIYIPMASKKKTLKNRKFPKRTRTRTRTPKNNKRKKTLKNIKFSKRTRTPKNNKRKKTKTRKEKLYKMRGCNGKQSGGVSDSILNAARVVPHAITNIYNTLQGNSLSSNFLPWNSHYS